MGSTNTARAVACVLVALGMAAAPAGAGAAEVNYTVAPDAAYSLEDNGKNQVRVRFAGCLTAGRPARIDFQVLANTGQSDAGTASFSSAAIAGMTPDVSFEPATVELDGDQRSQQFFGASATLLFHMETTQETTVVLWLYRPSRKEPKEGIEVTVSCVMPLPPGSTGDGGTGTGGGDTGAGDGSGTTGGGTGSDGTQPQLFGDVAGALATSRCRNRRFGRAAAIVGTEVIDRITGTNRSDRIFGFGASDRISGGRGNDCLMGDAGDDRLDGGIGSDYLLGGRGRDKLAGGPGNDMLDGGPGNDQINAGNGRDRISAGSGNDAINVATAGPAAFVNCGRGTDTVRINGNEIGRVRNCERVIAASRAR